MLTIPGAPTRYCDGVTRRSALKIGAFSFGATTLTLADVYAAQVAGLRRAEEVLEASEPWTEELVRRDQLAIDNYVISYGVSME